MSIPPFMRETPPSDDDDEDDNFEDFEGFTGFTVDDADSDGNDSASSNQLPKSITPESIDRESGSSKLKEETEPTNSVEQSIEITPQLAQITIFGDVGETSTDLSIDTKLPSIVNQSNPLSCLDVSDTKNFLDNEIESSVTQFPNMNPPFPQVSQEHCIDFQPSLNAPSTSEAVEILQFDQSTLVSITPETKTNNDPQGPVLDSEAFDDYDGFLSCSIVTDENLSAGNDTADVNNLSGSEPIVSIPTDCYIPSDVKVSHPDTSLPLEHETDEDEFTDFAEFQSAVSASVVPVEPINDLMSPATLEFEENYSAAFNNLLSLETSIHETDTIWLKLHMLDDTPALTYSWPSSSSNQKMLSALRVDARNILYGPWNKMSQRRRSGETGHLGDATELSSGEISQPVKAAVPDAHFDWEGSGLTNPLFASAKEEHLMEYDLNNLIIKKMSMEAEEILQSLPNLSYMKKSYIVFNRSLS